MKKLQFLQSLASNKNLQFCLQQSFNQVDLVNKILKTQEELGELSQCILKLINSKNVSASKVNSDNKQTQREALEEALDTLLCILDIINHLQQQSNLSDEEVQQILDKKITKWAKKLS